MLCQQHYDLRHRRVVQVQAFGSLRLDTDATRLHAQQFCKALPNRIRVRPNLWCSQDQSAVNIQDTESRLGDMTHGFMHEDDGIRALPLRVARREKRANVAGTY